MTHSESEIICDTLRPRQNGHHLADGIFNFIFLHKIDELWLKLHWFFFNYNKAIIGADTGLVLNRRQAIIKTNNGLSLETQVVRHVFMSKDGVIDQGPDSI